MCPRPLPLLTVPAGPRPKGSGPARWRDGRGKQGRGRSGVCESDHIHTSAGRLRPRDSDGGETDVASRGRGRSGVCGNNIHTSKRSATSAATYPAAVPS
eukprot:358364-Chlamydomonas_euryale.AAC.6